MATAHALPQDIDVFAELAGSPSPSNEQNHVDVAVSAATHSHVEVTADAVHKARNIPKPRGTKSSKHHKHAKRTGRLEYAPNISDAQQAILDSMLSNLYEYWYERGLVCITLSRISQIAIVVFVTLFIPFCVSVVQWSPAIRACDTPENCRSASLVSFSSLQSPSGVHVLSWMFIIAGSLYTLWLMYFAARDIRIMYRVSVFCLRVLNIQNDSELQSLMWDEVLERLNIAALQHVLHTEVRQASSELYAASDPFWSAFLLICSRAKRRDTSRSEGTTYQSTDVPAWTAEAASIQGQQTLLSAEEAGARIMRKENFLTGLLMQGQFNIPLLPLYGKPEEQSLLQGQPSVGSDVDHQHLLDGWLCVPYSKLFEWSLKYVLLPERHISRTSMQRMLSVKEINARSKFLGGVLLLVSPFVLMFSIIYYGSHQLGDIYASKDYIGPRRWSLYALRLFQEYNELPHMLQHRLEPSFELAQRYLRFAHSSGINHIGRALTVYSASVLLLVILMGLINENMTLYLDIGGRNLLWYATILGGILSAARSLSGDMHPIVSNDVEDTLAKLAVCTHFLPRAWSVNSVTMRSQMVYSGVSKLFPFRLQVFLLEVLSALVLPVVLLVHLPQRVAKMADCCRQMCAEHDLVGYGCSYALQQLDMDAAPITSTDRQSDHARKVAMSVASMIAAHPTTAMHANSAIESEASDKDMAVSSTWMPVDWDRSYMREYRENTRQLRARRTLNSLLFDHIGAVKSRGDWLQAQIQNLATVSAPPGASS